MAVTRLTYERPPAPVKRQERLTSEQQQRVETWRDRWLRVGMDTRPADRPAAEAAIRSMCKRIGADCPPIVWCNGPATMVLTYLLLCWIGRNRLHGSLRGLLGDSLSDSLRGSLRASLRGSLDASLRDSLRASLLGSLSDSLHDSLGASLDDSLSDSLRGSLRDSLGVSLRDSLRDSLSDSLRGLLGGSLGDSLDGSLGGSLGVSLSGSLGDSLDDILWSWRMWSFAGQHSLAWWAYWAFCRDELGVDYGPAASADLDLWLALGSACGWWRPRDGIIWCCERPLIQTLDEDRRLHNDTGPAILCRDGWAVWAVHGVRVARRVVEAPGTLTVEQISGEPNVEVRRIMIDRLGADRYLACAGAKLVDDDGEWGKLWHLELSGDEPLVMVEVVNSTPESDGSFKDYFLRVPPTMRSAHEAVAWTFDMRPGDYRETMAT